MIGLTSLQVYISIFNLKEGNNEFKLYNFSDSKSGHFSYEKFRDGIERDLSISDNTAADIQDEIIAPIISKE